MAGTNNSRISKQKLDAGEGRMLDFSTAWHEFNARGILENLRFGTLKADKSVGTATFMITALDDNGELGKATTKWCYAHQLKDILSFEDDMYSYDGQEVEIVNGEVSKVQH